jgi:NEDD4-binding protein 2
MNYAQFTLYILQGASGAGKSTLAAHIKETHEKLGQVCVICSTDDFFMKDGIYQFDWRKLGEYHKLNQDLAKDVMNQGANCVIDNTNIEAWQCKPYVVHALSLGMTVKFFRLEGKFPNVHGCPEDKVIKMRNSLEELTIESVLASQSPFEKTHVETEKVA